MPRAGLLNKACYRVFDDVGAAPLCRGGYPRKGDNDEQETDDLFQRQKMQVAGM